MWSWRSSFTSSCSKSIPTTLDREASFCCAFMDSSFVLQVQTAHNLAVLLFETNIPRAKQLFRTALDHAEDDSRLALISRSCASFYLAIQEVPQVSSLCLFLLISLTLFGAGSGHGLLSTLQGTARAGGRPSALALPRYALHLWARDERNPRDSRTEQPVQGLGLFFVFFVLLRVRVLLIFGDRFDTCFGTRWTTTRAPANQRASSRGCSATCCACFIACRCRAAGALWTAVLFVCFFGFAISNYV